MVIRRRRLDPPVAVHPDHEEAVLQLQAASLRLGQQGQRAGQGAEVCGMLVTTSLSFGLCHLNRNLSCHRTLASLLAKFRIETSDVIVIPDVSKRAEEETKNEFTRLIEGQDISSSELQEQKDKTNRSGIASAGTIRVKRGKYGFLAPVSARNLCNLSCTPLVRPHWLCI